MKQQGSVSVSVGRITTKDHAALCFELPPSAVLTSKGYAGVALLSLAVALRPVGLAPLLGSTVELVLLAEAQVSWPQGKSIGNLALPLVCQEVVWVSW